MMSRTSLVCLVWFYLLASFGMTEEIITPEQAKEAVRAFEGKADMEFYEVRLDKYVSGDPAWGDEVRYFLEDKDRKGYWKVNAFTGEVQGVTYYDAYPDVWHEEPVGPLTKEQCLQIAERFVRAKYRDFDRMNLLLSEEWTSWTGRGWYFKWKQRLRWGIIGPNGVEVEVNPTSGQIQRYSASRYENIPQPKEPRLTREQAIEKAKEVGRLVEVRKVDRPVLFANPKGDVFWTMAMEGIDAEGKYRAYTVLLNARTGEILDVSYAIVPPELPGHEPFKVHSKVRLDKGTTGWKGLGWLMGIIILALMVRWFLKKGWMR